MPFTTKFIVLGNRGSDAGYYVWDGHGWRHVGGWAVEQMVEVGAALKVIGEAARFKTPGLAESVTKSVAEFAEKELGNHLSNHQKEGGGQVVVIVAGQ